jgi:hypothetical protein
MEELKEVYADLLRVAGTVERLMESGTSSPTKAAVDVLLQIDASLNTEIGIDSTLEEKAAFKKVSSLILERCKSIDPDRFAIPIQTQVLIGG